MEMVEDDVKWMEAYLDTPFGVPFATSAAEAMKRPSCCVKSVDDKHFGRLVSYSEDRVVVRGHNSPVSPRFVWTGTMIEYFNFWRCD